MHKRGFILVLSLIILVLILFAIAVRDHDPDKETDVLSRNELMEKEMYSMFAKAIQDQGRSKDMQIEELQIINFENYTQGHVEIVCAKSLPPAMQEILVASVAKSLKNKYPQQYGEKGESWTLIDLCGGEDCKTNFKIDNLGAHRPAC